MKVQFTLFLLLILVIESIGQQLPEPKVHMEFWANYQLPGMAKNIPGRSDIAPSSRFRSFKARSQGFIFEKQAPKEVLAYALESHEIPKGSSSFEFLLLHHVHTPLGFTAYFLGEEDRKAELLFSYYRKHQSDFRLSNTHEIEAGEIKRYNRWWYHIVVTDDGDEKSIFINGVKRDSLASQAHQAKHMDFALYSDEQELSLKNILKEVKIYDKVLDKTEVKASFELAKEKIRKGQKFKKYFHFLAGPYLHNSSQTSINLLWETNMPANAIIEYGPQLPLENRIKVESMNPSDKGYEAYIQEVTLSDLQAGQKYLYNVKVRNYEGIEMESGLLSFKTAVEENQSFQFAAIGDTETRPHVNNQIAKQIWGERPDFVLHMGDLTDGGNQEAKWQWNYEYFEGMNQLYARIPVFPVPGNGEGKDLYWYKRYHKLGEEEAFYTFSYGNSDFFMMNSNERKTEFSKEGKQYLWLEEQLKKSTAQWKFVAMHHAPYSTDENDYGNAYTGKEKYGDKAAKQLIPLFEQYGVDIVFFGHLHSYSRMGPIKKEKINQKEGVWYIQSGGAGGNLEDFGPTRAWFSEKVYAGHHYCLINVMGPKLIFKMYDLEGRLRDFMELKKKG